MTRSGKVLIKITRGLQKIDQVKAHVKYVGFRSKEADEKGFFSSDEDKADYQAFIKRIEENPALQHSLTVKARKVIFSLRQADYDAYKRSGKDYKDLVRATLAEYERKHSVKLDWIANIHGNEGHPHVHVIIKGVSDVKGADGRFKRIAFSKDDIKDMKSYFDTELERDAQYHWHEQIDLSKTLDDMGKGFEQLTRAIERENERVQRETEFKKEREQKRKGRGR